MSDSKEADQLRADALADDGIGPELVEHKGHKYEVRPPTLKQQRGWKKLAVLKGETEPDSARILILALIGCTYHPGTDIKVFKYPDDIEVLEAKSTDRRTIVGKVTRVLERVMKANMKDAEEDFDEAPSASSSTEL